MTDKEDNPEKNEPDSKSITGSYWIWLVLILVVGGASYYLWEVSQPSPMTRLPVVDYSGEPKPVIELLDDAFEAVKQNPEDAISWGALGDALLANGFNAEARQSYLSAEELDPENYLWPYCSVLAMEDLDLEIAISQSEKALQLATDHQNLIRCRLADFYFRNQEWEKATRLVDQVLEKEQANAWANTLKAQLLLEDGKTEQALEYAMEANLYQPGNRKPLRILSQIHFQLGNLEQAKRMGERAAEPMTADTYWADAIFEKINENRRGYQTLVERALSLPPRETAKRIELLREAVNGAPEELDWRVLLAKSLATARRFADAESVLVDGLKTNPLSPTLRLNLGNLYASQNRFDIAQRELEAAVKHKPDFFQAYQMLGIVMQQQKKWNEARKYFEQAIKVDPTQMESHLRLGLVCESSDQSAKAIEAYQACLRLGESADAHFLLGRQLGKDSEQKKQAIFHLQKALQFNPTLTEAKIILRSLQ